MRAGQVKKKTVKPVPQQVRIIGGQWKRTPLAVVDADGLRPTPDRVRETVFNWLTHVFDGDWAAVKALDLFAGSGALGFEVASRGAAQVLMIENHAPALRQLQAAQEKLQANQIQIVRGDALLKLRELAATKQTFSLIFLDPPYHQEWLQKTLPLCVALLEPDAYVYAEAETSLDTHAPWLDGWEIIRADQAGMVFYHLLRYGKPSGNQA
ncbi:MAG: 16S rRNA (guanine(966)-N(2))-methyltransferase RsmD [Proteobacteria bacterium]|nr:16S rRNA (guanine(966)-N(2))-methyltransferase RsmD [Pseudomonadota bacterium]